MKQTITLIIFLIINLNVLAQNDCGCPEWNGTVTPELPTNNPCEYTGTELKAYADYACCIKNCREREQEDKDRLDKEYSDKSSALMKEKAEANRNNEYEKCIDLTNQQIALREAYGRNSSGIETDIKFYEDLLTLEKKFNEQKTVKIKLSEKENNEVINKPSPKQQLDKELVALIPLPEYTANDFWSEPAELNQKQRGFMFKSENHQTETEFYFSDNFQKVPNQYTVTALQIGLDIDDLNASRSKTNWRPLAINHFLTLQCAGCMAQDDYDGHFKILNSTEELHHLKGNSSHQPKLWYRSGDSLHFSYNSQIKSYGEFYSSEHKSALLQERLDWFSFYDGQSKEYVVPSLFEEIINDYDTFYILKWNDNKQGNLSYQDYNVYIFDKDFKMILSCHFKGGNSHFRVDDPISNIIRYQ